VSPQKFDKSFRAAEKVQNDYISLKFPIDRTPHLALYLNFGTLAILWPWAIRPSLKIEILHHHHEISDP
jgi:hypothetical protein